MKNGLYKNLIISTINAALKVLFPLITFKYVSIKLGVEYIGEINFANSIISYFLLFASLGLSSYAIREGAKIKEDKNNFNIFVSQIFSISFFMSLLCLIAFLITILIPLKFNFIFLILGFNIFLTPFGIEWLYIIQEDYFYITMRNFIFQLVSLVLILLLVKESNDYLIYCIILVISNVGSNVLNFINAHKYCKISLTKNLDLRKHGKPIAIIFGNSVASTLYINSDMTILGLLCGTKSVGYYSFSVKIYSLFKTVVASFLTVGVPRVSSLIKIGVTEAKLEIVKLAKITYFIFIPIIIFTFIYADKFILLLSSKDFIDSLYSLRLLLVAIFFSLTASFFTTVILLPMNQEKRILFATLSAGAFNVIANFILIYFLKEVGAAITTIFSEVIVCGLVFRYIKKNIHLTKQEIYKALFFISKLVLLSFFSLIVIFFLTTLLAKISFNIIILSLMYFIIYCILAKCFQFKIT